MDLDTRDTSILTQVAFKEASAHATALNLNLTAAEHQAVFEEMFSYLTESLFQAVRSQLGWSVPAAEGVQNVVQAFPGTTQVPQGQIPMQQYQPVPQFTNVGQPAVMPPQPQYQQSFMPATVRIKGQQHGPIPDWLSEQAAEKGVGEVYDNRDRAQGTRRPWFKATTGGDNAIAFWPPR